MARPVVVWFRDDLRVHDNPALMKAWELVRANPADLHAVYIANEVGFAPLVGQSSGGCTTACWHCLSSWRSVVCACMCSPATH